VYPALLTPHPTLYPQKLLTGNPTHNSKPPPSTLYPHRLYDRVGVEVKFKNAKYPVIVAPTHVPELNTVLVEPGVALTLGASVTLTMLEHACVRRVP